MAKVTIALQDGEFIARHQDHVGIIGVGDTEQEALQELAEALGALAFRVNMKDELLGLYRNFHYHVYSGNVGPRDRLNEKILKLEKELGEMK